MALIAIQQLTRNGSLADITFTTADAGGTDEVPAEPNVIVLVKNTGGSGEAVNMVAVPCSHGRSENETQTVPATTGQGMWNLGSDPAIWKQTDGNADFTHSGAATLSIAAVKIA